ncbi:hypothetical protein BST95_19025 [Halioglobus japonicus]|nr:hypothetical protein BST95_19025 [Halioglobus japonicus]
MRIVVVPLLVSLLLATGCATVTEAGYYWGDYSTTLYNFTKNPSEETLAAHEEELHEIIEYSADNSLTVPPGIYAELGYINAKRGDDDKALAYYEAEMQNFPSSRHFLERLVAVNKEAS